MADMATMGQGFAGADQPSILTYAQPVQGWALPATPAYRPPAPSEDSDDDGDGRKGGSRKVFLAIVLAVTVVLILLILFSLFAPRSLARSLEGCGWTVYLLKGCGYCEKQMRLLGGFRRHIRCSGGSVIGGYTSAPPLSCSSIQGFPLWYNTRTGEKRTGYQDSAALEQMARQ